jgi:5-(carboxyamino)imidazole ribonucleotide mutase
MTPRIGIILGSGSDLPHWENALQLLKKFSLPYAIVVSSAHRTPERTLQTVHDFEAQGVGVIIAAAGGAAHLPGVVAGHTLLPVLGVPMPSNLLGIDSLLAIAQMPAGIPVATFGIGEAGARNAVLFAIAMLAVGDESLRQALAAYRREQQVLVVKNDQELQDQIRDL